MRHLSLAGRDGNLGATLYTWFSETGSDILYKNVSQSTTPALRASLPVESVEPIPSLYPNPVQDVLTIEGIKDKCIVNIYNVLGAAVGSWQLSEEKNIIDVGNLKQGIYIFKITSLTEKQQWFQKIIKM